MKQKWKQKQRVETFIKQRETCKKAEIERKPEKHKLIVDYLSNHFLKSVFFNMQASVNRGDSWAGSLFLNKGQEMKGFLIEKSCNTEN